MTVAADALTTGSLMTLTTSSASLNSTNGLLNVANTGASTTGMVARIQSNSTAGSGMTVLANGNVGIGTTGPTYPLDISGTPGVGNLYDMLRLQNSTPAVTNNGSEIVFASNRTTGGMTSVGAIGGMITDITNGSYKGALIFSTANNATPAERMRIDNSGNVGIGTATPSANLKLQVNGAAASKTNVITSGASVDLSLSNVHLLKSVGSSTIALSNMADGGSYTLVVSDTTQATYTFTGCTNSYFSPTNGQTYLQSTYSILVVVDGANTNCFISWVTGFN
jgi:hypothetical protein